MKSVNLTFLALVAFFLGTTTMNAQDDAKDKTEESKDRFAYSYGVLLGDNLEKFGLEIEDINLDELIAGLKAAMANKDVKIDNKEAQQEVNQKLQELQQNLANKQLEKNDAFMEKNAKKEGILVTESGIQYEILTKGTGTASPTPSNKVSAHYHGTLINGTVFDSSVDRGTPIDFPVTGVIKGWQEILQMMKTGDKYRVYIPPHLAYGSREQGKIPANSILIFEMELLEIK